jgi:glutamyl-tRNA reductase
MEKENSHFGIPIGVLGLNHKSASLKVREGIAKACEQRFSPFSVHGKHHFILLSTCNRTEIYFSSADLPETHTYLLKVLRGELEEEFDHALYSFFGPECFIHLAKVTAGCDSAILGETEIQGQVKLAYERSSEGRALPKELHFLFQKCLKIGKEVRNDLRLEEGANTLEGIVYKLGQQKFIDVERAKVLLVGASEVNLKMLSLLKRRGLSDITLCNRSIEKSVAIAEEYKIKTISFSQVGDWIDYDWVIFGTKYPGYLIEVEGTKAQIGRNRLLIDLSVPRNVDPKFSKLTTLMNIDQLHRMVGQRKQGMRDKIRSAEEMIHHAAIRQIDRFEEKEKIRLQWLAAVN